MLFLIGLMMILALDETMTPYDQKSIADEIGNIFNPKEVKDD